MASASKPLSSASFLPQREHASYVGDGVRPGAQVLAFRVSRSFPLVLLVGMPLPDMYSMELSLFVLAAGVRLLERERPDLMYLSLTDYIQHKHAPGDPVANEFYRRIDAMFGELAALGAVVALTADHGMNDKSTVDGRPNVVFLQDILDREFGAGDTRVICPITDAFVRHHGALGGFVRVWCVGGRATPRAVIDLVRNVRGVAEALDRESICARYQLPPDQPGAGQTCR